MTAAAAAAATAAAVAGQDAAWAVWTAWSILALLFALLETAARRPQSALVPLTQLTARVRDTAAGRGALVVGWAWLGWHVFAR